MARREMRKRRIVVIRKRGDEKSRERVGMVLLKGGVK